MELLDLDVIWNYILLLIYKTGIVINFLKMSFTNRISYICFRSKKKFSVKTIFKIFV